MDILMILSPSKNVTEKAISIKPKLWKTGKQNLLVNKQLSHIITNKLKE